jgi:hypothetical protein
LIIATALALAWSGPLEAVQQTSLTKEQQLNKLKLEDRQLLLEQRRKSLETYRKERDTTKELFDEGFIALQRFKQTLNKYEQAVLDYEKAEILLDQTKLDLLEDATHIIVAEARKYKTDDGKSMVDLVLENASDTRNALLVDQSLGEEELRTLLKVENIFVSLKAGPIVGEPYERRIASLAVGERKPLKFRLLQDQAAVVVEVKYLETIDRNWIILKKGGRQDLPSINSAQFSQEGELNNKVNFGLTLERLADEEQSFSLAILGLPQRIDYAFVDQSAKVNQVKFDENTSQIKIFLELEIPEKLDRRFIGRTRTFFALVTHPSQYAPINTLKVRYGDEPIPEKEIRTLQSEYVKLELIPKGVGKLEVLVANRYQEIKIGEELQLRVEFLNRGSVAVQNIKAELDLPYEWESEVDPTLIKLLEPDERTLIRILTRPPHDIAVGDYELGVEAQGQVGNENIESLEKNITIRIGARSNIAGNTILIGILVLLVLGIGLASIKISRR